MNDDTNNQVTDTNTNQPATPNVGTPVAAPEPVVQPPAQPVVTTPEPVTEKPAETGETPTPATETPTPAGMPADSNTGGTV